MRFFSTHATGKLLLFGALLSLLSAAIPCAMEAAGVTIITHGYELDSSYPAWVTAMADHIPNYFHARFPALDANFTTYKLTIANIDGTFYSYPPSRTNGSPPFDTESGEIIIELDWSALSGDLFDSYASTSNVAYAVSQVLLATNSFPELNGHPAIELPIHLVGHSRGGSLMSQISYVLGTNGIWTDHFCLPTTTGKNSESARFWAIRTGNQWRGPMFASLIICPAVIGMCHRWMLLITRTCIFGIMGRLIWTLRPVIQRPLLRARSEQIGG
jgi:hypothetical protein